MADIIDVYTDKDDGYYHLSKMASRLPQYVVTAELQPSELIPDKGWAFIEKTASGWVRRLPINNKINARLSIEYLHVNKGNIDKFAFSTLKNRIEEAIKSFSDGEIEKIAEVSTEIQTDGIQTLPLQEKTKDWASLITSNLLDGKRGVGMAINAYRLYAQNMPPRERFEVAKRIADRAEEMKVSIPRESRIYRYRLIDVNMFNKHAEDVVRMRFNVFPQELCESASILLGEMRDMQPIDVANKLSELDKVAGIDSRYDSDVLDPFIYIFGKTRFANNMPLITKEASARLSESFDEQFVKEAQEDPKAAYKKLGRHGKKMMRDILNNIVLE